MKIVLTRNVEYDFDSVYILRDDEIDLCDGYIQTSKVMDVDFKMLSDVDLTAAKVEVIDEKISKAEAGIHLLKQAKAELLAIDDMRTE